MNNDKEYTLNLSSKLQRFKVKKQSPFEANFRCPICGDSKKSSSKCRGWIRELPNGMYWFKCFNCFSSMPLGKFIETIDPSLYKKYSVDSYINKHEVKEESTIFLKNTIKEENEKSKLKPLSSIKKISQLKFDHPAKIYIDKRQIPTNQHYRLYYAPKFKKWINSIIPDKFESLKNDEPRLILPFIDEKGNCFGINARSFDPNANLRYISIMFDTSKQKIFGLDKVDKTKPYYIVEGPIDSLFIDNSIAMAGADGNYKDFKDGVFVFDNEPRNKEIHKRMSKLISAGCKICIWPSEIHQKDINEMYLNGYRNIKEIIDTHTYQGLRADMELSAWRKT
jgi:transcription elongation factor Elf1